MAGPEKTAQAGGGRGREVELKLRVEDLSDLMKIAIASGGRPEPTAYQKNRYLDTNRRDLDALPVVLRLRRERVAGKKRHFLTAKGPGLKVGNVSDVQEEEVEIDDEATRQILSGGDALLYFADSDPLRRALVTSMRGAIGKRPLEVVGVLKNERTRIDATLRWGSELFAGVLELDRTTFPGNQVHHEVELEVPAGVSVELAQRAFQDLFARAGVVGRESPGKARRFFQALRGEKLP